MQLTHRVQIVEHLVHAYHFVVELVVAVRTRQKSVAVRYEQVEYVHRLQANTGAEKNQQLKDTIIIIIKEPMHRLE